VRYAAFLRAINVGKHNRVTMATVRELFASAGFRDVSTYLQTGNVLFEFEGDEADAVQRIDGALAGHGLRNAAASVRSSPELFELVAVDPFAGMEVEPKDRFVSLFQSPLPAEVRERLEAFPGVVAVRERELITQRLAAPPPRDQDAGVYLSKAMWLQGTARYWHVVEAVSEMLRRSEE
jgi:uncharacterized protein (DUF1697 family)